MVLQFLEEEKAKECKICISVEQVIIYLKGNRKVPRYPTNFRFQCTVNLMIHSSYQHILIRS